MDSGIPMKNATSFLIALFLLAGCGESSQQSQSDENLAPATDKVIESESIYAAAVGNPSRPEKDRERDADREPAEVLEFFGIGRSMNVLDMFSGGGYYTEILSYVVGPEGSVTSHSNEAYAQYVGDEAVTRYSNDRLPNVEILMAENNELSLNEAEFDAILLVMAYHDTYHSDPKNGWHRNDVPAFLPSSTRGSSRMASSASLTTTQRLARRGTMARKFIVSILRSSLKTCKRRDSRLRNKAISCAIRTMSTARTYLSQRSTARQIALRCVSEKRTSQRTSQPIHATACGRNLRTVVSVCHKPES